MGLDERTGQNVAGMQLGLGDSLKNLSVDEGNIRMDQTMGKVNNVTNSVDNGMKHLWDAIALGAGK